MPSNQAAVPNPAGPPRFHVGPYMHPKANQAVGAGR
jgi:hypothetical protein